MQQSLLPLLLLSLFISSLSSASANESLKVAVTTSFLPVLETIKPRLVQQLGMPVQIVSEKNSDLYDRHLQQLNTPYDVIIFAENEHLSTPLFNKELLKVSDIITSTQVVLWCPYIVMPKRVGLLDIIKQVKVRTIAIPDSSTLIGNIFTKNIPKLPKSTYFVNTSNSLTAWRMANTQQTECAVTLDKWLKPTDQFNYVSTEPINFRGWVKANGRYTAQSTQIVSILSSPLLQPIMIRATNSDTTQDMK